MFEKKLKELGDMILMAHEFGNDHHDREEQLIIFNELVLAYEKQKRITYLEGILKFTIWADNLPNGNEICDEFEAELKKLKKDEKD